MTTEEALAEEQRLLDERDQARKRDGELSVEVERLKMRRAVLAREHADLLKVSARGQPVADRLADAQSEQDEITVAIERAIAAREGAATAWREAEAEVAELRVSELIVLAQDADIYTAKAQDALAAAEAPYLAAQAAWEEAEQRWARLRVPVRQELQELQAEDGIYHSARSITGDTAPSFPLPDGQTVFGRSRTGSLVARPAGISTIEQRRKEKTA